MKPLLTLNQLNYSYHTLKGELEALKDISMDVYTGEFLAIVGPSGCGKSTLFSVLSGLAKPESGSIVVRGHPLEQELISSRIKIGYMLQKDYLFEWRTIEKNIMLGLELNHCVNDENLEYIDQLLKLYDLYHFRNKKPSELSGGMRQRAALIRTMALKPDLYLLDEPFSALDFQTRITVSSDIASILRNTNKTAILVTHDLSEAITLADRIIVLTKRPATVKHTMTINFDMDRADPVLIRNTTQYQKYFKELWEVMSDGT